MCLALTLSVGACRMVLGIEDAEVDPSLFSEVQSGKITKQMISESINWNPLPRLYLQADASYVLNQTDTPASNIDLTPNTSPTVLNFHNDYWTVTASIGYLLNDKTDLHLGYSFYQAHDFVDNAQQCVTAVSDDLRELVLLDG